MKLGPQNFRITPLANRVDRSPAAIVNSLKLPVNEINAGESAIGLGSIFSGRFESVQMI